MQYLVGRIMCNVTSNDDPLRDEIDNFFKLLMIDNISYTMVGICKVGRPLISTVSQLRFQVQYAFFHNTSIISAVFFNAEKIF